MFNSVQVDLICARPRSGLYINLDQIFANLLDFADQYNPVQSLRCNFRVLLGGHTAAVSPLNHLHDEAPFCLFFNLSRVTAENPLCNADNKAMASSNEATRV